MYIQVEENTKCSKCGAKNFTETVIRGKNTYMRCRGCGHEKLTSTLTTSSDSTPSYFSAEDLSKEREF